MVILSTLVYNILQIQRPRKRVSLSDSGTKGPDGHPGEGRLHSKMVSPEMTGLTRLRSMRGTKHQRRCGTLAK
jgi:hypothetical protein